MRSNNKGFPKIRKRYQDTLTTSKENYFESYNINVDEPTLTKLKNGLSNALEINQFILYYQAQMDLKSGRIKGIEALIRWQHPEYGVISPKEFVPLAEETGFIVPLGKWVLRKAIEQNKAWQNKGLSPITVAVNISVLQIQEEGFIEDVKQVLNQVGLDPQFLQLEITESIAMEISQTRSTFQALNELGVKISIDDFGMGYGSLYYLKELPIDYLKIHQSFVRDSIHDLKTATIVKTIISLAHHLDLQVIAEGVESKEQFIFLQRNLCDQVQGYLFSKPLPSEELEKRFLELKIYNGDGNV